VQGLRRHERQFQVIDYPIHDGNLRDEGEDSYSAALMGAMSTAGLPHLGQTIGSTS